jgi:hypothetical protein
MLVGSRFLFVCPFPPLQIPNFKTPAIAYERDFIFQSKCLTKFVRQNEATLTVRACMLSARMQLTQEHTTIGCRNLFVCFRGQTHFRKLLRRHNQQKLVCRLRQKNEILRTITSPARWDGDPVFLVNGMSELSGIEAFGLGIGVHWSRGAVAHFTPLDPTFNHLRSRRSIKIFGSFPPNRRSFFAKAPASALANVLLRRRSEIRKLVRIMKRFRFAPGLACALLMCGGATAFGQASTDAVRVTMSMHPDGSRTVYNFDNAQHTAVATTTDPDGKVRQTIRYQLDNAGRFSTGEVSGPDGRVRLKSRYKYDDAGRILEETQSAANGTLLNKIVYSYDPAGKQTGYSVFDASGKLVSRTGGSAARPSPSPKPREKTKR